MATVYNCELDAFDLYHIAHESSSQAPSILGGPTLPALGHALAGSTGAAISSVCTYPLSLIITRLQIQRQLRKTSLAPHPEEYASIQDAIHKIYSREGLSAFYVGLLPDTSKTIADSFLFFLVYNFLRQSRLKSQQGSAKHLSAIDELGVGFLAGAFAKLFTTPIANIVTRKQSMSMLSARSTDIKPPETSVRAIVREIKTEKGLPGFWSGYSASLVLTLNPSLTFFLFETFKRTIIPRRQRESPSAQATFFLAAFSKAIASTVTYPFSLAKARAQASSTSTAENEVKQPESLQQAKKIRAPRNVFGTILEIAQHDGIGALYEGLGGEVLKGFFSHGITMIVKDSVHKLIIRLYYTILKLLRKHRSSAESTVAATKAKAVQAFESVKSQATHGAESAQARATQVAAAAPTRTDEARIAAEATVQRTSQAISSAKAGVQEVTQRARGSTPTISPAAMIEDTLKPVFKKGESS
ncbi:hypothetical protein MMC07_002807 [Pseudocyphellaria aurata]|nr:hypothetical protein [Pseudocyphellaria aurata]